MGQRGRLWVFRLIAVILVPLLVLAALEGILRLAGSGYDPSVTVECVIEGRDAFCDNRRYAWRFFPPRIARSSPSFSYPADKGDRTYRIFVLGGSAAQGDPEPTYSFSRILEVLLRDRHPDVRFEVVNTGITAINSHGVVPVAREIANHDPDLFVVYLGNNEIVGPYGPGTIFSPMSRSHLLIRAGIRARGTRIGQLAARALEALGGADGPKEWQGMEMFLGRHVRRDDARLHHAYSHFRRNLEEIATLGSRSGARVILSTVVSNLRDSAPFASLGRDDLDEKAAASWERSYREGVDLQSSGENAAALRAFREAEAIDDTHADLRYRSGQTLLALENADEAASHLVAARDLDVLRFRADGRINEIIRSVVASEGVALVDGEKLFESNSANGIPGSDFLLEHVHPNFSGNYLLASGLLAEVEARLPSWAKGPRKDRVLSEEECAARLAYTAYDRHRLLGIVRGRLEKPPFTEQSDHRAQFERVARQIAELAPRTNPTVLGAADGLYRDAIREAPDDPWLRFNHAGLLIHLGRHVEAAEEYREFLTDLPHDVPGREKLSAALTEAGRFEEAVVECRTLVDAEPDFAPPYRTMAYALARLGRFDESIATYRRLLEVDPSSWEEIYNEIGRILIHVERFDAALATFREAILQNDRAEKRRIPDLYFNYAHALKASGKPAEAREAFRQAADWYREELAEATDSSALHLALASALVELEEYAEASQRFREAARLDPDNYTAHSGLAASLARQDRGKEAQAACREGIRALLDAGSSEGAESLRRHLAALEAEGQRMP